MSENSAASAGSSCAATPTASLAVSALSSELAAASGVAWPCAVVVVSRMAKK